MSKKPKNALRCKPASPSPGLVSHERKRAGLTQFQAASMLYRSTVWWQELEYGNILMDPALWEYWLLLASELRDDGLALHEALEDVAQRKHVFGYITVPWV